MELRIDQIIIDIKNNDLEEFKSNIENIFSLKQHIENIDVKRESLLREKEELEKRLNAYAEYFKQFLTLPDDYITVKFKNNVYDLSRINNLLKIKKKNIVNFD